MKTELLMSKTAAKITIFHNLLAAQGIVGVLFDPTVEGVIIHASLRKPVGDPTAPPVALSFDYGFRMVTPIPEIEVTEEGLSAVLSVRGLKEPTFLPWLSVFAFLVGGTTGGGGAVQVDEQPKHLRTSGKAEPPVMVDANGLRSDRPIPPATSKGGSA